MGGPHLPMAAKRIVVLEDDGPLRAELLELLSEEGYEAMGYGEGRKALEALRTGPPPDLILLDMYMPDMNGWEFRNAQKSDPVLALTPVVVLSGSDDPQVRAVDAVLVLRKPFESRALLASIEQLFAEIAGARQTQRDTAQNERLAALGTLAA